MGARHDLAIFRSDGLKDKMLALPGKMVIADRGCRSSRPDEVGMISIPSTTDPPNLKQFKSRVRSRHESFNGRLTQFGILRHTFASAKMKHKACFEAVCVIVQCQMDNGSPLFDS